MSMCTLCVNVLPVFVYTSSGVSVSTVCVGTICMNVSPVFMFVSLVCEFFTCVCATCM